MSLVGDAEIGGVEDDGKNFREIFAGGIRLFIDEADEIRFKLGGNLSVAEPQIEVVDKVADRSVFLIQVAQIIVLNAEVDVADGRVVGEGTPRLILIHEVVDFLELLDDKGR